MNNDYSFIGAFIEDVGDTYRMIGGWHLVPYYLLTFLALGGLASWFVPIEFFAVEHWGVSVAVYAGILAFNAITLALSWAALGRVLEILSNPGFSSILKSGGIFNTYRFYVSLIHIIQAIAALITFGALICILIPAIPIFIQSIFFGLVVTTTLYAVRWALGSVRVMSDLIAHFATFDGLDEGQKQKLRLAVDNGGGR